VDARTKDGGSRSFFATKTEAETHAQQCRIKRENSGRAAFSDAQLAQYGWTVQRAIDYALTHLRQQEQSIPINDAVKELVAMKRKAGKSQRYCHDLELRLGRFVKAFDKRTVAGLSAKDLDGWLAGLAVAPGTRNTFRRDLRTLFSFCEKRGYCADNEAAKTERANYTDAPPGILTVAEAAALLAASPSEILPYVAIGMFAGLRAAELEKLDWAEVDLHSKLIEVTASKSKTKKRRHVKISNNLARWLRPFSKSSGPVAPVGLRKKFDSAKEKAGLNDWPQNALRHSFASYHLAKHANAAALSLEMGNSPQIVFAHYRELVKPAEAEKFWKLTPKR
jgi:integrase